MKFKMKLVGSRAKGIHRSDSDWDIAIDGVIDVPYVLCHGWHYKHGVVDTPTPVWHAVGEKTGDHDAIRSEAIATYHIPVGAKIDLFFTAQCLLPDQHVYALVNHTGHCVRTGRTIAELVGPMRSEEEGYF